MSQIRVSSLTFGLLLAVSIMMLAGCGEKNSQADLNPISGKHPAGWLPSGHTDAAKDHLEACTECHGSDFSGGVSKIACTQCHIESAEAPHPSFWNYTSKQPNAWGKYAYAFHAPFVRKNGTKACANVNCHGADLKGASGPSCSSCHMGGPLSAHPVTWVFPDIKKLHGPYVDNVESQSCRNVVCHGSQGQGVFLSGPSCVTCHK